MLQIMEQGKTKQQQNNQPNKQKQEQKHLRGREDH